jgi:hypothetical protein
MRKAFSMLTAIVIIVLMATVAAFIMNLSGKMVKSTTVQFQREQAVLLAKSYTEYAVMAVTANEHNSSNCLNTITGTYGPYNVQVDVSYIGNNLHANCLRVFNRDFTVETIDTPKSQLNIIVDVFVDYPDLDNPNDVNMTYHRRSLQKI